MELKVTIEGTEPLQAVMARVQDTLINFRVVLKTWGLVVLESVNRNFMVGGRPAWVALSPATIKRRRGSGTPQPLRDSGILMASISSDSPDGWSQCVEVGTNVPYAGAQNFGTRDGHVPARPFMEVQPEDVDTMVKVAVDEIDKAIKGTT